MEKVWIKGKHFKLWQWSESLYVTTSEILSSLWKILFLNFTYKVHVGMHHSFQAWADIQILLYLHYRGEMYNSCLYDGKWFWEGCAVEHKGSWKVREVTVVKTSYGAFSSIFSCLSS